MTIPSHHHILKTIIFATLLFSSSASASNHVDAVSPASKQVFHYHQTEARRQMADEFGSEKRRVPTGSNPLHNK